MLMSCKIEFAGFFLLLFLSLISKNNYASESSGIRNDDSDTSSFNIQSHSFLLPQAKPPRKFSSSIYFLNVFIPRDWTHDIIKAPMFSYAAKYSLPAGFDLHGCISTLIISNRICIGPFWNLTLDNYHIGFGYQLAFNYGFLTEFGFDTRLTGWEQQPTLLLGAAYGNMAVTLRGDLYVTSSLYLREGESVIPFTDDFLNGFSITASLEQRLYKKRVMSLGIKWSYLRYHILAWPAFPVNRYRYDVPEFQIGLNF